jgi:hypothetical protein
MDKYWIFIDDGDFFKTGKIIDQIGDEFIIVKFTKDELPDRSEIFSIKEIMEGGAFLFETEPELAAWLTWLDTPQKDDKPKIINIKDIH